MDITIDEASRDDIEEIFRFIDTTRWHMDPLDRTPLSTWRDELANIYASGISFHTLVFKGDDANILIRTARRSLSIYNSPDNTRIARQIMRKVVW